MSLSSAPGAVRRVLCAAGVATLVAASACTSSPGSPPGSPPERALIGQRWSDPSSGRELIFDGAAWVARDAAGEVADPAAAAPRGPSAVIAPGATVCTSYACNPGGAHARHGAFLCRSCHRMHGPSRFDPAGPAVIQPTAANPSPPAPGFDPASRSCSNVACHGVPAGTFSYYFPGGDGEPELKSVGYGGTAAPATPSWYATGAATCDGCHGNPPASGTWHASHGALTALTAQCQTCHPDASSVNGIGNVITNPALHMNGVVDVQARFRSSCFGCH